MNKKKLLIGAIGVIIALCSIFVIWMSPSAVEEPIEVELSISYDVVEGMLVYYNTQEMEDGTFSEECAITHEINTENEYNQFIMELSAEVDQIRIDVGTHVSEAKIEGLYVESGKGPISLLDEDKMYIQNVNDCSFTFEDGVYVLRTNGEDPYVVIDIDEDIREQALSTKGKMIDIAIRIIKTLVLLCVAVLLYRRTSYFKGQFTELYRNRNLIMDLAKNDFKTKYAGSYLGVIWAFIQPIVTVAVYSFVFQVGFRSGSVEGCPYVLWLVAGMVPWFFFTDSLMGATNTMLEYSYLVKKVVFKISILPIVKILSAMVVHIFFVVITFVLFAFFGWYPDFYCIQVVYYTFCLAVFVFALSYITCSIIIFFRDLGQIISITLQIGMWMTPIMWQETMLSENVRWILKLNPIYYIVTGYRNALIDKVWFWQTPKQFLYFWGVTAIVFVIGSVVFKKLKVHFADVL